MTEDITPILEHWPYEPGEITVRKVAGLDGSVKVQLRLDLGLLQMEVTGRPDGRRPHGFESLLAYHQDRLARYRREHGSDTGFALTAEECEELRAESTQYYHRYLGLYHLEDFEGVVADTSRNLDCLDFLRTYASDDDDRVVMEQYRPYILMMHARAKAAQALQHEDFAAALDEVHQGIRRIEAFLREVDQVQLVRRSVEIASLRRLEREILERRPTSPLEQLREQLKAAVAAEEFELAASLRDQLRRLEMHKK
jgi:hypothetical protein